MKSNFVAGPLAMMMALVVLLVVGMVAGLALQAILQSHRQTRDEAQRVQAELLADAALSRAVLTLAKDPNWKGENWTVTWRARLLKKWTLQLPVSTLQVSSRRRWKNPPPRTMPFTYHSPPSIPATRFTVPRRSARLPTPFPRGEKNHEAIRNDNS